MKTSNTRKEKSLAGFTSAFYFIAFLLSIEKTFTDQSLSKQEGNLANFPSKLTQKGHKMDFCHFFCRNKGSPRWLERLGQLKNPGFGHEKK